MPDSIALLPDSVANQIAAGEVIQRPSSVVKELIENALDARATSIKVIIKEAGKSLIQVIDDGTGMSETDARLSFERHTTSKIRTAEDMLKVRTMGFRGEALASVAAVAQVEMKTRLATKELGTFLVMEQSKVISQEQDACELGTSISVKNLFFNIPVRKNFLKSNQVEMKHITEVFHWLALGYSNKSFMLLIDDQVIYELRPEKLSQRIVALFGKSYQKQLASCSEETTTLKVKGYIGRPEMAKKTRGNQYLFVNGRYIKSNYINHAVLGAFKGLLTEGAFPFYTLFVEIDPKHVDVNVHPTKTEIKFDDARTIYAIISASVHRALGLHNLTSTIDFGADVNIMNKLNDEARHVQNQHYEHQFGSSSTKGETDSWHKLVEETTSSGIFEADVQKKINPEDLSGESMKAQKIKAFQFRNRYLIMGVKKGLMIIDQQVAHERVLYEKYSAYFQGASGVSQQSLFPQVVELSLPDFSLVMEMKKEIMLLGFRFEIFGKSAILVNGVPSGMLSKEKSLFEGFVEQFKINQAKLSLPRNENLAWSLARRASVKRGDTLLEEEIDHLIEGLFACHVPGFDSWGKPTFFIFENTRMDQLFNT